MNTKMAYCTIVARNYLPQALALNESISRLEPQNKLYIVLVDGNPMEFSLNTETCELLSLENVGFTQKERDELAAIYDVVELSTAVKPRVLLHLLEQYEQAIYLDPDTQLISPLEELDELIEKHGIVLTPHILDPIAPGATFASEMNVITVGVHNLGFCAVGREAVPFLDWWWSHLERECLKYPLLGLFVDQKWTDIGAVMFSAFTFKHRGYNIAHWNLHERRIEKSKGGKYLVQPGNEQLRLLHFSGFNPNDPEAISNRQNTSLKDKGISSPALLELSHKYAEQVLKYQKFIGIQPDYEFNKDSNGKKISIRMRRAYRQDLLNNGTPHPPSAFNEKERVQFRAWRMRSTRKVIVTTAMDLSLAFKYAFPDTYSSLKRLLPNFVGKRRESLFKQSAVRR